MPFSTRSSSSEEPADDAPSHAPSQPRLHKSVSDVLRHISTEVASIRWQPGGSEAVCKSISEPPPRRSSWKNFGSFSISTSSYTGSSCSCTDEDVEGADLHSAFSNLRRQQNASRFPCCRCCQSSEGEDLYLKRWWLKRKKCLKAWFTVTCMVVHIIILGWVWCEAMDRAEIHVWRSTDYAWAQMMQNTLPLIFWLILEWIRTDSSAAARQAGWLFWYHWFRQCIITASQVTGSTTMWVLKVIVAPGEMIMTIWAIWWRVRMAETAYGVSGCANCIAFIGLVRTVVVILEESTIMRRASWDNTNKSLIFLLIGCICWWRFSKMLRRLSFRHELLQEKAYLLSEARWAIRVLRRVRLALALLCFAGVFTNGLRSFMVARLADEEGAMPHSWFFLLDVPTNIYLSFDFVTLLLTVGFFHPNKPTSSGDLASADSMDTNSTEETVAGIAEHRSQDWKDCVMMLGHRYIEARELLSFYIHLFEIMPHFDCDRHTTNDIVRAAIIPGSYREQRGRAYADWLQDERASRRGAVSTFELPQRMVTHDWRNLFMHLVAAVLADALEKDEYGPIAHQLQHPDGVEELRTELLEQRRDAGKIRYWICAFCVNQHRAICGGFPPEPPPHSPDLPRFQANRVDSVLGSPHQCCPCDEPKFWSGDKCEMNKFDDLMQLLVTAPDLRQVVAIDRNFELFSRVWCVAELVEAHDAKISQNVCLPWKQALDANLGDLGLYLKLATLSVKDCSATREEDKDRILRKIRRKWGVGEFDAQLQATIFGPQGLLGKEIVGFDVIYSAARAALRVKVVVRQLSRQPTHDSLGSQLSTSSPDDLDVVRVDNVEMGNDEESEDDVDLSCIQGGDALDRRH